MTPEPEIEAFILAGGKSSRMGHDKGLAEFRGKPMIGHVIASLTQTKIPFKIIANNNDYCHFGIPVISDLVREKGPMGGLYTAMHIARSSSILLLSCDTPLLPAEAILHLTRSLKDTQVNVGAVKEKLFPLFAVYKTSLKPVLKNLIDKQQLRMTNLIHSVSSAVISLDRFAEADPLVFSNINSMNELKDVERKIS